MILRDLFVDMQELRRLRKQVFNLKCDNADLSEAITAWMQRAREAEGKYNAIRHFQDPEEREHLARIHAEMIDDIYCRHHSNRHVRRGAVAGVFSKAMNAVLEGT